MHAPYPLPVRLPKEVPFLQASKWMKYPVLLSFSEMKALIDFLSPLYIAIVSAPVAEEEMFLSSEEFLETYRVYIESLIAGTLQEDKKAFSSIWTASLDPLYQIQVGKRFLVKSTMPVLQLQRHHFIYSEVDHQIHSMVLTPESISWGIQFSYPQLFEDPTDHTIKNVQLSPNAPFFKKLAQWMREWTMPTPFVLNGKTVYSTIRVGKELFPWISQHPHLKGLKVACGSN